MGVLNWMGLVAMASMVSVSAGAKETWDASGWDRLVSAAIQSGESQTIDGYAEFRFLSRIEPNDMTQPRVAQYFTVMGASAGDEFNIGGIWIIREDWSINADGDWEVDQWIYTSKREGALISEAHNWMKQSPNGRVLDYKTFPPASALDPATVGRWHAKVSEWISSL